MKNRILKKRVLFIYCRQKTLLAVLFALLIVPFAQSVQAQNIDPNNSGIYRIIWDSLQPNFSLDLSNTNEIKNTFTAALPNGALTTATATWIADAGGNGSTFFDVNYRDYGPEETIFESRAIQCQGTWQVFRLNTLEFASGAQAIITATPSYYVAVRTDSFGQNQGNCGIGSEASASGAMPGVILTGKTEVQMLGGNADSAGNCDVDATNRANPSKNLDRYKQGKAFFVLAGSACANSGTSAVLYFQRNSAGNQTSAVSGGLANIGGLYVNLISSYINLDSIHSADMHPIAFKSKISNLDQFMSAEALAACKQQRLLVSYHDQTGLKGERAQDQIRRLKDLGKFFNDAIDQAKARTSESGKQEELEQYKFQFDAASGLPRVTNTADPEMSYQEYDQQLFHSFYNPGGIKAPSARLAGENDAIYRQLADHMSHLSTEILAINPDSSLKNFAALASFAAGNEYMWIFDAPAAALGALTAPVLDWLAKAPARAEVKTAMNDLMVVAYELAYTSSVLDHDTCIRDYWKGSGNNQDFATTMTNTVVEPSLQRWKELGNTLAGLAQTLSHLPENVEKDVTIANAIVKALLAIGHLIQNVVLYCVQWLVTLASSYVPI